MHKQEPKCSWPSQDKSVRSKQTYIEGGDGPCGLAGDEPDVDAEPAVPNRYRSLDSSLDPVCSSSDSSTTRPCSKCTPHAHRFCVASPLRCPLHRIVSQQIGSNRMRCRVDDTVGSVRRAVPRHAGGQSNGPIGQPPD
jgi:hypothetical protein